MKKEKLGKAQKESAGNKPEVLAGTVTSLRGRTFQGIVVRKFPKRVAIEFERVIYVFKYERYFKKKTRIHARLPDSLESQINVGDYIKVQECRPLSKIIHFTVLGKVEKSKKQEKKQ